MKLKKYFIVPCCLIIIFFIIFSLLASCTYHISPVKEGDQLKVSFYNSGDKEIYRESFDVKNDDVQLLNEWISSLNQSDGHLTMTTYAPLGVQIAIGAVSIDMGDNITLVKFCPYNQVEKWQRVRQTTSLDLEVRNNILNYYNGKWNLSKNEQ